MGFWSNESGNGEGSSQNRAMSPAKSKKNPSNETGETPKKRGATTEGIPCKRIKKLEKDAPGTPTKDKHPLPSRATPMILKPKPLTLTQRIMAVMNERNRKKEGCTHTDLRNILSKKRPVNDATLKMTLDKAVKQGKLKYYRRRYMFPDGSSSQHDAIVTSSGKIGLSKHAVVRSPKGTSTAMTREAALTTPRIKFVESGAKSESPLKFSSNVDDSVLPSEDQTMTEAARPVKKEAPPRKTPATPRK